LAIPVWNMVNGRTRLRAQNLAPGSHTGKT